MSNKKQLTIFIITIFFSSLALSSAINSKTILAFITEDEFDNDLQPNRLCEIDSSFPTHVGMFAFEYLDGMIYGVDGSTN